MAAAARIPRQKGGGDAPTRTAADLVGVAATARRRHARAKLPAAPAQHAPAHRSTIHTKASQRIGSSVVAMTHVPDGPVALYTAAGEPPRAGNTPTGAVRAIFSHRLHRQRDGVERRLYWPRRERSGELVGGVYHMMG